MSQGFYTNRCALYTLQISRCFYLNLKKGFYGKYLISTVVTKNMTQTNFITETIKFYLISAVIFKTCNGKVRMLYKDMKYYQQREGKDKIRWRCTKRGCRAFYLATAADGSFIKSQEVHNHSNVKFVFDYNVRSFVKRDK